MKILFINQTFFPDTASTAQHLSDAVLKLSNEGHEVTVLTSRRGYNNPSEIYLEKENYRDVQVFRCGSLTSGKKSKMWRIYDSIVLQLSFAGHLFFKMPAVDRVVAMTSPPLIALPSILFAKLKKAKFIYWVMDMNPQEAIRMGWIKEEMFFVRILKQILKFILVHSDCIIALDQYMKKELERSGAQSSKIVILPPWSHDEDLEKIKGTNFFREKHSLQNKFIIMYSGNHSICHPLNTLLEAARKLKNDKDILFMFIGSGERVKDILEFKNKYGLENISYLSPQPRKDLAFSLSSADIQTVVMGENMVGIVHPCKIYGLLRVGKPVIYIGPSKSHVMDMTNDQESIFHVPTDDVELLVTNIRKIKQMDENQLKEIQMGLQSTASNFSQEKLLNQFSEYVLKAYA